MTAEQIYNEMIRTWIKAANDETMNPRVRLSIIADSMKRWIENNGGKNDND